MPIFPSKISSWLERHREKLTDAALLFLALNLRGMLPSASPTPWIPQAAMLVIFAALASPRAHLTEGTWRRYRQFLPGYVAASIVGVGIFGYWFALPAQHWWFAPLWLVLTAIVRLPLVAIGQRASVAVQGRRLDILALDLLLLFAAVWAVPLLGGLPRALLPGFGYVGLGWAGLHLFIRWHDPARFPRLAVWSAPLLALAWAFTWRFAAGEAVGPAALAFGLWLAVLLLAVRLAVRRWAATGTEGIAETMRWLGLLAASFALFHPFARSGLHGSGDALYYATFLADTLEQFRHGIFPVFVGQSEFQFNGSVIPIRIAPGFQYVGGLVDLLTGRTLGPMGVQNLVIALTGLAGLFSAYACLRRTGARAGLAWGLALLYLTCPGAAGLAFNSDLYMSWLTFPFVPPVLLLGVLSFRQGGWPLYAGLGFVLGLTWWMHTPVALWLTSIASALQAMRLAVYRPGWPALARELVAGAAAFLLTAAYPVVSAVLYPADPGLGSSVAMSQQPGVQLAGFILDQLHETFPAAWLPMSPHARVLTDYQLGYGLLLTGALAGIAAWRTGRLELRGLAGLAAGLLLLLVPVPWLTLHLWQLFPSAVLTVTNVWVMQRLYLLLAGVIVFLAAAAWTSATPGRFVRVALLAAGLWSLSEASKFVRGSQATTSAGSYTTASLLPENVTLTRYSYGLFAAKPAYFTHGVTDPVLENRFLAADLHTVVGGNPAAASGPARTAIVSEHLFFADGGRLTSQHPLVLQPGRRYLVEVVTTVAPFPVTTMVLSGTTLQRVYSLPEYGESRSFGLGGGFTPFFPLHTSSARPESVSVQLIPADGATLAAINGRVMLRLTEYDPAALPVRVRSWLPYAATVQSNGPVWLETPRMFQTAYAAQVNGRPAEVRRSAEGLASVAVPAGRSEVELRYVAPAGLAGAFWLSLGTIAAGTAGLLVIGARRITARPGAGASPG